jgi:hypothetical protein
VHQHRTPGDLPNGRGGRARRLARDAARVIGDGKRDRAILDELAGHALEDIERLVWEWGIHLEGEALVVRSPAPQHVLGDLEQSLLLHWST